jgi:hypothetical protein
MLTGKIWESKSGEPALRGYWAARCDLLLGSRYVMYPRNASSLIRSIPVDALAAKRSSRSRLTHIRSSMTLRVISSVLLRF